MAKNLSISPSVASLRFAYFVSITSIHIFVNILNMNISKNSYNGNTFIFELLNSGNSHKSTLKTTTKRGRQNEEITVECRNEQLNQTDCECNSG